MKEKENVYMEKYFCDKRTWTHKKPNIKCIKCDYEWNTQSTSRLVTCPSCHKSTPNPNYKEKAHWGSPNPLGEW
jgi:Zn finger protein HypA/HybF involved in hydrogenase expression